MGEGVRVRRVVLVLLAILGFWALSPGGAAAQPAEPTQPFRFTAEQWSRSLDEVQRYVQSRVHSRERSREFRELAEQVRLDALVAKASAESEGDQLRRLLAALGPAPPPNETAEPAAVTQQRDQYETQLAILRSRAALAELAVARAEALLTAIAAFERTELWNALTERLPFPLDPRTLGDALPELLAVTVSLAASPRDWLQNLGEGEAPTLTLARVLVIVVAVVLLAWAIRRFLLRRLGRQPEIGDPSYLRVLTAALAEGVAYGLVPALVCLTLWFLLIVQGTMTAGTLFAEAVEAALLFAMSAVLVIGVQGAVLSPELPSWRLTNLTAGNATRLSRILVCLVVVFAADLFMRRVTEDFGVGPALDAVYTLVTSLVLGTTLMMLSRASLWERVPAAEARDAFGDRDEDAGPLAVALAPEAAERPRPPSGGAFALLRRLVPLIAVLGMAAAVAGYSALASFLLINLIFSGLVIGFVYLLRGLLRELVGMMMRSRLLRERLGVDHRLRRRVKFWLRTALDPVLFLGGLILIAPIWSVPIDDLRLWLLGILDGFSIGQVQISPADIAVALIAFVLVLAASRLIQRQLSERILPETSLDEGLQNSVVTGAGYIGLVVAFAVGVGFMGIDLTSVALIAGALSVGIGLGLQDAVNNFVSGVILLIERPIKVGDWVVVGPEQGFVKKINIRATEIETFEMASVIIPNSTMLSNAVVNWTLKDRKGRVDVAVRVAFGTDTARVHDLLLQVAHAHPMVLRVPAPFVLFQDFADSGLIFELRCYTGDVVFKLSIASDLRFEIDRLFRAEGIEVPFPHLVVRSQQDGPMEMAALVARPPNPRAQEIDGDGGGDGGR